jgi:hypothetical protein
VWDSLRKQVALERQQLRRLLDTYHPLFRKSETSPPDDIELSALGATLHSFYSGIENIFKRTTLELGDRMPSSEYWHKELLDAMAQPTGQRRSVISPELRGRLKEYMEFRHVFRHAYIFNLRWDRMKTLVLGCEETFKLLEDELDRFFAAGTGRWEGMEMPT